MQGVVCQCYDEQVAADLFVKAVYHLQYADIINICTLFASNEVTPQFPLKKLHKLHRVQRNFKPDTDF
jgi:hypothetical protein